LTKQCHSPHTSTTWHPKLLKLLTLLNEIYVIAPYKLNQRHIWALYDQFWSMSALHRIHTITVILSLLRKSKDELYAGYLMTTITVIVLLPCYKTSVGLPCSTGVNECVYLYYTNLLTISQLWKFQIISHQQESTTRSLIILQILELIHTCTVTSPKQ